MSFLRFKKRKKKNGKNFWESFKGGKIEKKRGTKAVALPEREME